MNQYILIWFSIILSALVVIVLITVLTRMVRKHRWFGVPFIRTKQQSLDRLVEHIQIWPGQVFVDLGCGDGIVMNAVLDAYPWIQARWYELDPKVVSQSASYQLAHGSAFQIIQADYLQSDISDADVVYCYLLPRLMTHVWKMILRQCKPGTIVYSYVFPIPDLTPTNHYLIDIPSKKSDTLYQYLVPTTIDQ